MPVITQIVCDGCRAVKREANHWYTLVLTEKQEAILRPMAATPADLFTPEAIEVQYFCGRRCVGEAFDRWMDGLTAL